MKTHVEAPAQRRFVFDDFRPTSALLWSLPAAALLGLFAASKVAGHLPPSLSWLAPFGSAGMDALDAVALGTPLTTFTSIIAIVYCFNHTGWDSIRRALIGFNIFAPIASFAAALWFLYQLGD